MTIECGGNFPSEENSIGQLELLQGIQPNKFIPYFPEYENANKEGAPAGTAVGIVFFRMHHLLQAHQKQYSIVGDYDMNAAASTMESREKMILKIWFKHKETTT